MISPSGDYNILSIPFGPIELLNAFDMHLAALILTLKASTPLTRDFAAYSLIIMYGRPNSSKVKLILFINLKNLNFK